ncbi:MAG: hypothetical protein P4L64_13550 [Caulobacteraceae bacterium]|nr:hypothetical protein [Caulobacteraceae bacterium]
MTLSHPARALRRAMIAAGLFAALAFAAGASRAETILFVGNSFTYGARSPV